MAPKTTRTKTTRKAVKAAPPPSPVRDTPVTGIRLPEALRARLDVIVAAVNTDLAREHGPGVSTSRSALVVRALDEWSRAELARRGIGGAA